MCLAGPFYTDAWAGNSSEPSQEKPRAESGSALDIPAQKAKKKEEKRRALAS
jgi:hypothetical protein